MKSLVVGQDLAADLGIPGIFVRAAWELVRTFHPYITASKGFPGGG